MGKIIGAIAILCVGVFAYLNIDRIKGLFSEDTRTVNSIEVKLLFREDPTEDEIIQILLDEGVISTDQYVREFIAENAIDPANYAAGKYVILSGTQVADLMNGFQKNEFGEGNAEVMVNVVFNRCVTIEDIGMNIGKCILADSASIVEFIKSPATLEKYRFSEEQMPAMFLPSTYQMYFDTDAEQFVQIMAEKFKAFWTEERKAKISEIGLSYPSQVATVASIVYSEQSQMSEEWPIIASVYLNRIRKGMKLESDPTFKFCWGDELDGVERLLNIHKAIDCPYNTYLYGGIPPGPICVVPAEVIDAVLNPAQTDYIFMCGKPGGAGHNFATTNAQHERNASEYIKWLKKYLEDKEN
ncbi:MAG: endolytic transglycosylase MltG [Crocinitomicaceae bacterium]|nr:endolytic transglycosylase MltG [Crocinitomicaceae bacterium]